MEKPCTPAQYRQIWERLIHVCPPPFGTVVHFRRSSRLHHKGETSKRRNVFTVTVRMGMCFDLTEETAIHEYAHVCAWRPHHALSGDHDEEFGIWYSRVYRSYHHER